MIKNSAYGFEIYEFVKYRWPDGWGIQSSLFPDRNITDNLGKISINPTSVYPLTEFGDVFSYYDKRVYSFSDFYNRYSPKPNPVYNGKRKKVVLIPVDENDRFDDMCKRHDWEVIE